MPDATTGRKAPHPDAECAFFNAQNEGDPTVCVLRGERVSDGSDVYNVAFLSELVFCLDKERAMRLVEAVNAAVKESQ